MSEKIKEIIESNIKFSHLGIISGKTFTFEVANDIKKHFNCALSHFTVATNSFDEGNRISTLVKENGIDVLLAIGGGKVLDVAKYVSNKTGKKLIVCPTTLSHDGISSVVAVLKQKDNFRSIATHAPVCIIIDIDIVKRARDEQIKAGAGDLLSNLSAVEDWILAHKLKGEKFDPLSEMIARNAAEEFIRFVLKNRKINIREDEFLYELARCLALSGIAMNIAGSSRPCSGAEHLISHALDKLLKKSKPHGIQVGIATLYTQKLRKKNSSIIKKVYNKISFPTKLSQIGIDENIFMEAVRIAPQMRKGRFTILDIKGETEKLNAIKEIK